MKKIPVLLAMMLFSVPVHADTVLETKLSKEDRYGRMKIEKILESRTGCEVLKISGDLKKNAAALSAKMVRSLKECDGYRKVYLDFNNGYFNGSMKLGRLFRKNNVHTHVNSAETCGTPCSLAYLGGRKRTMGGTAHYSFHQPISNQGYKSAKKPHCLPGWGKNVKNYINEILGHSAESALLGQKATSRCGEDLVIRKSEAIELGIVTHRK